MFIVIIASLPWIQVSPQFHSDLVPMPKLIWLSPDRSGVWQAVTAPGDSARTFSVDGKQSQAAKF